MSLLLILRLRSIEWAGLRDRCGVSLELDESGEQTYLATALIVEPVVEPLDDQLVSVFVDEEWLELAITVTVATAAAAVAMEPRGVADTHGWLLELFKIFLTNEPLTCWYTLASVHVLNLVITLKNRSASSSQMNRNP